MRLSSLNQRRGFVSPRSRFPLEGAVVHVLLAVLVIVCGYAHPIFEKEES